jgi:hypothetical protein
MLFGHTRLMHPLVQALVAHRTVTVKLQVQLLLQESVARQLTVVVVFGSKVLPEGGLHTTVTVPLLQQLSVAVGE